MGLAGILKGVIRAGFVVRGYQCEDLKRMRERSKSVYLGEEHSRQR